MPRGYLNRTALSESSKINPQAFHFTGYNVSNPKAPFKYTSRRFAPANITWPPKGIQFDVYFKAPSNAPSQHQAVQVTVTYEMYDGIPLLLKYVSLKAVGSAGIVVQAAITSTEYLNLNNQWADGANWLIVETDFPHSSQVSWNTDPKASHMPGSKQPVLNCTFTNVFTVQLSETFQSFKVSIFIM